MINKKKKLMASGYGTIREMREHHLTIGIIAAYQRATISDT